MSGACSTLAKGGNCIQYFGWKTWRKETTGKI